MLGQVIVFVIYIWIIELPQNTWAECSQYYILLEMEQMSPPEMDWKGIISPKNMLDMSWNYPMNTTNEYDIIQKNINCVLKITYSNQNTMCVAPKKIYHNKSIHQFIPSVTIDKGLIVTTDRSTAFNNITTTFTTIGKLDAYEETTPTAIVSNASTETSSTIQIATSSEPNIPNDFTESGSNIKVTTSIDNSTITKHEITTDQTTKAPTTERSFTDENSTHEELTTTSKVREANEEKNDYVKAAAIFVGSAAGGAVLVYLTTKTVAAIQSGTYRFPDPSSTPLVADSRV